MGPSVRRSSCIIYLLYFPSDQTVVLTHNSIRLEPSQLVTAMTTPSSDGKTIVRLTHDPSCAPVPKILRKSWERTEECPHPFRTVILMLTCWTLAVQLLAYIICCLSMATSSHDDNTIDARSCTAHFNDSSTSTCVMEGSHIHLAIYDPLV